MYLSDVEKICRRIFINCNIYIPYIETISYKIVNIYQIYVINSVIALSPALVFYRPDLLSITPSTILTRNSI